jgi:hypothetical protein
MSNKEQGMTNIEAIKKRQGVAVGTTTNNKIILPTSFLPIANYSFFPL